MERYPLFLTAKPLATSQLFHAHSDIDLLVWDIQHYYRAVAHLLDLDPEINFDLIPIEDARPAILELVEKEGLDL